MSPNDPHYVFCRLAVDKAKLCVVSPTSSNPPPRVAVVFARGSKIIGWYAKGVGGQFLDGEHLVDFVAKSNAHAEQALIEKMHGFDFSDATAYVTLEPCTKKKAAGLCCADLLVQTGFKSVFIANCDPNPDVGGLAWRTFHANGVVTRDFPPELRNEARRDNDLFFRKFHFSVRDSGKAAFDYASVGSRTLGSPGREFNTRWTNRDDGSIYALDYDFNVAVAKHCTSFDEIDDPARWFEDSYYTKPVDEGQIVIFRNNCGYALVKILRVRKQRTGVDAVNSELKFEYQLRYAISG
ncbi:hypothetical protein EJO68_10125 [Variovorax atrisoli]|uniref:hypothetical protein n=1 Tax=Variovorax atrisoli TaxID=3394203 RepID=UPI000F7EB79F|nr:hypothetical protein [Variovorax sp. 369]RTD94155.1 hypothetical protein EJO68_10125 [Variovorax sp. 369]